jgi:hypothetical protein
MIYILFNMNCIRTDKNTSKWNELKDNYMLFI